MSDFTFKKSERLCSKKAFDFLFEKGSSYFAYPLKAVYSFNEIDSHNIQIAFTASKRNFKKAVSRNKIKRLLREIYRKNKHLLNNRKNFNYLQIVIIYTSKEILPYAVLEISLLKIMNELASRSK